MSCAVGVTGAQGFVGYHISGALARAPDDIRLVEIPKAAFLDVGQLKAVVADCDVIVHLAAMNRGEAASLHETNVRLTRDLLRAVSGNGRTRHIIFSSSIQESQDNAYARSKRECVRLLNAWAEETGGRFNSLTIPNVFGPFCKPFYNSVVATFCHQLAAGEAPVVKQDAVLDLVYVNDLADLVLGLICDPRDDRQIAVASTSTIRVSALLALLRSFQDQYLDSSMIPELPDVLHRALFVTFLTYLDAQQRIQPLSAHADERGALCEVVKARTAGQAFFSTTRPGVVRGNHFHRRKFERFCVISGEAEIKLRRIGCDAVVTHRVSGEAPASVDIPVWHTHSLANVGDDLLLALFWTDELFNEEDPDTYYEKVL